MKRKLIKIDESLGVIQFKEKETAPYDEYAVRYTKHATRLHRLQGVTDCSTVTRSVNCRQNSPDFQFISP